MSNPGFQTVPEFIPDEKEHRRKLARAVNQSLSGKINASLDVVLKANSATTTITDARISFFSTILWMPQTAHAAAEIASGNMYIPQATQLNGQLVIQHSNNAQADRNFRLVVIG